MTKYVQKFGLKVDVKLNEFLINSILPGLKITEEMFWKHFANTVKILGPKNRKLLEIRQDFQNQIDSWHIKNRNLDYNLEKFKEFLKEINYIISEGDEFTVDTENVDPEIASIAGPQLVVPVTNARYALNAVNVPVISKLPLIIWLAVNVFAEFVLAYEDVAAFKLFKEFCVLAVNVFVPATDAVKALSADISTAVPANEDVATATALPLALPTHAYPLSKDAVKLPVIFKLPFKVIVFDFVGYCTAAPKA